MALYADELAKVTIQWTPNQTDWSGEEANCGFWVRHHHFTGNDWDWSRDLQGLADGVLGKLDDHWSDLADTFGAGYQISSIRAAHIAQDGKELDAKTAAVPANELVGTGTKILPPETAMCLSFFGYVPGTFTSHAGRKRSRTYLPYINTSMCDAKGKVLTPSSVITRFVTLFNAIQGMHGGIPVPPGNSSDYWDLVVASGVDASWHNVERLGLDDHFDSQRRRQHQTPPIWAYGTISHS